MDKVVNALEIKINNVESSLRKNTVAITKIQENLHERFSPLLQTIE
jgi:hypothetical protein